MGLLERNGIESPPLVPRNADQVENAPSQSVPNTIFANPGHAGTVIHRDLQGFGPIPCDQDWQESVETIERKNPCETGSFERAERASGVREIVPQRRGPCRPGNSRGELPDQAILPMNPLAADKVVFAKEGEHLGKLGGIVLQIAIQGA